MLKYGLAAAALLFVAAPAQAALNNVTFTAAAPGVQGGGAGFETAPLGALASGYSEAGLTFTPTNDVRVFAAPTVPGTSAFPFGDTSRQYLSVLGGSAVSVDVGSQASRISLYWGSVDTYNTIEFYNGATLVGSLTGGDVSPLQGDGGQFDFQSNRLVTVYLSTGTFDSVRLLSSSNSFEFDNISSGVPEPSTWAMMLIGFAGLGYLSRRKSNTSLAAA